MGRMVNWKRLRYATCGLVLAQMIHAGTPADTSSEGYVGLIVGLVLLVAAVVAAIGSFGLTPWTPRLAFVTGTAVAVGFMLYHAVPAHTPVTNPYLGEPVGITAWLSVVLAVAAGVWAAVEGWQAMAPRGARA
jgi:hypothetical protein